MKGKAVDRRERLLRETREDEEVRLAKALGHPRRVAILECLNANGPMAPVELSRELRLELSNLCYHVRELAKGGLIEAIGQEKGQRGFKTTYRATARALLSDAAWSSLSPTTKAGISATMFGVLASRASDALQAGTFDSRNTRHLSISTVAVDREGWEKVTTMLAALFHRLDEIEEEADERGGPTVPMSVGLLGFESPRMYE